MNVLQWFVVPAEQAAMVAVSVGLAALIRAFTGFGFAMLVVPVFSFFLIVVCGAGCLFCCVRNEFKRER